MFLRLEVCGAEISGPRSVHFGEPLLVICGQALRPKGPYAKPQKVVNDVPSECRNRFILHPLHHRCITKNGLHQKEKHQQATMILVHNTPHSLLLTSFDDFSLHFRNISHCTSKSSCGTGPKSQLVQLNACGYSYEETANKNSRTERPLL